MKAVMNDQVRIQVAVYGPKVKIIQTVVCEYFGIPIELSQKHIRKGTSIYARKRIHYLCRIFVNHCPLSVIGLLTGNGQPWDHASISNSYRNTKKELEMRNPKGYLVYPEVHGEIQTLSLRVKHELEKAKLPHDLKMCECCNQPIIVLE